MEVTKTSYSTTRTAGKLKLLILLCICFLIFIVVSIVCFVSLSNEIHRKKMIEGGEKVTAEIYACAIGSSIWNYECYYKYVDENGTEYVGIWGKPYRSREEAEQNLGKQVEIYIDGKGKSTPVETEINFGWTYAYIAISLLLTCADVVGIVIISIKIDKERKRKKWSANFCG